MLPPAINGRLLPHFDLDSSAMTPTIGCIIKPEIGPAIHTIDIRDLVMPRLRRYGVQSTLDCELRSDSSKGFSGSFEAIGRVN